jgi:hypothetical protein
MRYKKMQIGYPLFVFWGKLLTGLLDRALGISIAKKADLQAERIKL